MVGYVTLDGNVHALAAALNYAPDRLVACVRAAWEVVAEFNAIATTTTAKGTQGAASDSGVKRGAWLERVSPTFFHFLSLLDTALATQQMAETEERGVAVSTSVTSRLQPEVNTACALAVLVVTVLHPYLTALDTSHEHRAATTTTDNNRSPLTHACLSPALSNEEVDAMTAGIAAPLFVAVQRWEARVAELAAPTYEQFYRRLLSRASPATRARLQRTRWSPPPPSATTSLEVMASASSAPSSSPSASASSLSWSRNRAMRLCQRLHASQQWGSVSVLTMVTDYHEKLRSVNTASTTTAVMSHACEASFTEIDLVAARTTNAEPLVARSGIPRWQRRRRTTDGLALYVDVEDIVSNADGYDWLLPLALRTGQGIARVQQVEARVLPLLLIGLVKLVSPELCADDNLCVPASAAPSSGPSPSPPASFVDSLTTTLSEVLARVRLSTVPNSASPLCTFVLHRVLLRLVVLAAPALASWRCALCVDVERAVERAAELQADDEEISASDEDDKENSESATSEEGRDLPAGHLRRRVVGVLDSLSDLIPRAREVHVYERFKSTCTQLCAQMSVHTSRDDAAHASAGTGDGDSAAAIAAWRQRQRQARSTSTSCGVAGDGVDGQWVVQLLVSLLHARVFEWSSCAGAYEVHAAVAVWGAREACVRAPLPRSGANKCETALGDVIQLMRRCENGDFRPRLDDRLVKMVDGFRAQVRYRQAVWCTALRTISLCLASLPTLWSRLDAAGMLFLILRQPHQERQQVASPLVEHGHVQSVAAVHEGRPLSHDSHHSHTSDSPRARTTSKEKYGPVTGSPIPKGEVVSVTSRSDFSDVSRVSHSASSSPLRESPEPGAALAVGVVAGSPVGSAQPSLKRVANLVVRGTPTTGSTTLDSCARPVIAAVSTSQPRQVWSVRCLPERLPAVFSVASAVWLAGLALRVVCPGVRCGSERAMTTAAAVAFVEWFLGALVKGLVRTSTVTAVSSLRATCANHVIPSASVVAAEQREAWERQEAPVLITTALVALTALFDVLPAAFFQSTALNAGGGGSGRHPDRNSLSKSLASLTSVYFPTRTSTSAPEETQGGATKKKPQTKSLGDDVSGGSQPDRLTAAVPSTVPTTDLVAFLAAEAAGRQLHRAYERVLNTLSGVVAQNVSDEAGRPPEGLWARVPRAVQELEEARASVWLLCEAIVRQPSGLPLSIETQAALAALLQLVCRLLLETWSVTLARTAAARHMKGRGPLPDARDTLKSAHSAAETVLSCLFWMLMALLDVVVHAYAAGCPVVLCSEVAAATVGGDSGSRARDDETQDFVRLRPLIERGLSLLTSSVEEDHTRSHWFRCLQGATPAVEAQSNKNEDVDNDAGGDGRARREDGAEGEDSAEGTVHREELSAFPLIIAVLAVEAATGAFDDVSPADVARDNAHLDRMPACVEALLVRAERRCIAETVDAVMQLFLRVAEPQNEQLSEQGATTHAEARESRSGTDDRHADASADSFYVDAGMWPDHEDSGSGGVGGGDATRHSRENNAPVQRLPIANPVTDGLSGAASGSAGTWFTTPSASSLACRVRSVGGDAVYTTAAPTSSGRLLGFIPAGRVDMAMDRSDLSCSAALLSASHVCSGTDASAVEPTWMPDGCQQWWARLVLDALARDWWSSEAGSALN